MSDWSMTTDDFASRRGGRAEQAPPLQIPGKIWKRLEEGAGAWLPGLAFFLGGGRYVFHVGASLG
jgi:hypothetical protein